MIIIAHRRRYALDYAYNHFNTRTRSCSTSMMELRAMQETIEQHQLFRSYRILWVARCKTSNCHGLIARFGLPASRDD